MPHIVSPTGALPRHPATSVEGRDACGRTGVNPSLTGNDVPVSRNASPTSSRAARDLDVPAATRTRPSGWRDPRLWVGVVLVTGSVVAGARILSAADDMTQ